MKLLRTGIITLTVLTGLLLTRFGPWESGQSAGDRIAASDEPVEVLMQVEHGQAMAAPPRASRLTEEARSVVDRGRAQAQHTAPSRSLATLASIRSTWIAGADAGVPNTVLEVLEATLHTHPASSPEAQLARRALDDLLALRDRHLRGGRCGDELRRDDSQPS